MFRHFTWALAGLLLAGVPAHAATCEHSAQPPQSQQSPAAHQETRPRDQGPFKWWMDEKSRAELGITDQQSAAIEQLWQASLPKLRAGRQLVDQLDGVLSQMIRDAADESAVSAQIDRAESARSAMNRDRTLMLYRMNRVLTADQRLKLKAMHDRWEASRRSGSNR